MHPNQPVLALQGPSGFGTPVEGEAIVSTQGFNARYDMDRTNGTFSRPGHDLFGLSCVGKIFVFATPKGGIATSWALLDLKHRGLAPLALVCRRANPVVVQGAVLAGISIIDRLDQDPSQTICTGDWIRLDPARGELLVIRRGSD